MDREPCNLCQNATKDGLRVVTTKARVVCWDCVGEAVEYYREALNEE